MAIILTQTDTSLTFETGCATESSGKTNAAREIAEGGSAGSSEFSIDPDNSTTAACILLRTDGGIGTDLWKAGDHTFRINVTGANGSNTIVKIYLCERQADGTYLTIQEFSTSIDISTTGIKSITLTQGQDYDPGGTDSDVAYVCVVENTDSHGGSGTDITPSEDIDTPYEHISNTISTMSGVQLSGGPMYQGPFVSSAGSVYIIAESSTTEGVLRAMKVIDPNGGTWSEQDNTNRPALTASPNVWVVQDGETLHVFTQHLDGTAGTVYYHVFDMETDTWTTIEDQIANPTLDAGDLGCSAVLRSDGELVVIYQDDSELIGDTDRARLAYARGTAGSWTLDGLVSRSGIDQSFNYPVAVLGDSDRVHFVYHGEGNAENNGGHHRSLSASNTFDTRQRITGDTEDSSGRPQKSAAFVDGQGDMNIRIHMEVVSNTSVVEFISDANPIISLVENVADHSFGPRGSPAAPLMLDGTDEHVVYPEGSDFQTF